MVTLKADNRRRVQLPDARPGDVFAYERRGETRMLIPVEPVQARPAKVTIRKRSGYSVGVLDREINAVELERALAEFP